MEIQWTDDVAAALARAKSEGKPPLLDFTAAPMSGGCARLEAEVYPAGAGPRRFDYAVSVGIIEGNRFQHIALDDRSHFAAPRHVWSCLNRFPPRSPMKRRVE